MRGVWPVRLFNHFCNERCVTYSAIREQYYVSHVCRLHGLIGGYLDGIAMDVDTEYLSEVQHTATGNRRSVCCERRKQSEGREDEAKDFRLYQFILRSSYFLSRSNLMNVTRFPYAVRRTPRFVTSPRPSGAFCSVVRWYATQTDVASATTTCANPSIAGGATWTPKYGNAIARNATTAATNVVDILRII